MGNTLTSRGALSVMTFGAAEQIAPLRGAEFQRRAQHVPIRHRGGFRWFRVDGFEFAVTLGQRLDEGGDWVFLRLASTMAAPFIAALLRAVVDDGPSVDGPTQHGSGAARSCSRADAWHTCRNSGCGR